MIETAHVIGAGRVGSAISARLRERGLDLAAEEPELVLLCVPDRAIAEVACRAPPGPWVAHVSGATPLAALAPHDAPLQRASAADVHAGARRRAARRRVGGGDRRDDARGARARLCWLARRSGLRAVRPRRRRCGRSTTPARRSRRTTWSRFYRAAARLLEAAGAPPEALVPLMRRTIDNDFELTGPIARGDWATVDAHLASDPRRAPRPRADVPRAGRTHTAEDARCCERTVRRSRQIAPAAPLDAASVGLVPTMGALHDGHVALVRRGARASARTVVASMFVNPAQFDDPGGPGRLSARRGARRAHRRRSRRRRAVRAGGERDLSGRLRDLGRRRGRRARLRRRRSGPGHFRGVATVCLKLFSIVRPDVAFFGQKDAQQVAVVAQMVRDLNLDLEIRVVPTVRDADGLALSSRNVRLSRRRARARAWRSRARSDAGLAAHRAGGDRSAVAAARSRAPAATSTSTTSASPTSTAGRRWSSRRGSAGTRLIDNVASSDGTTEQPPAARQPGDADHEKLAVLPELAR